MMKTYFYIMTTVMFDFYLTTSGVVNVEHDATEIDIFREIQKNHMKDQPIQQYAVLFYYLRENEK
jgi:hypothetical protein